MLKDGMFLQGRYEIVGKIGTGGTADVYKAKDHKLNRFVAVKVLKAEFRNDKAFIRKFRTEAQAAAGLAHPNIVNIYDVGEEKNVYFIVMELVEGITLKEYIGKKGRLAVREATSIAIQVSQGLEAAHNSGIIHRDVKPQNIIISTDGKVKVTDFGIARAADTNTISTTVMGSVHYSSPEQARGGYSDAKSDIYSLGISLYEMLTGHLPFDGDSTVAIAIKHLQEEIKSPLVYVPDLPRSTVQIIYKCTQKSPDRRYSNMAELIRDLKESLVNPEGDFVQLAVAENTDKTAVISREELKAIKEGYNTGRQNQEDAGFSGGSAGSFGSGSGGTYGGTAAGAYGNGNAGTYGGGNAGNYGGANAGGYGNYGTGNGFSGQGYGNGYNGNAGYDPYTYGVDSRAYGNRGYDYQEDLYEKNRMYQDDEEEDKGILNPKLEKIMTVGSIIIAILIGLIFLGLIANALGIFKFSLPGLLGTRGGNQTTASTNSGQNQSGGNTQSTSAQTEAGQNQVQNQTNAPVVVETQTEAPTETETENPIQIEDGDAIQVPDVVGQDYDTAVDMLMNAGFYVSRQDDPSNEYAAGTVMEQSMTGNAKAGSTVILIVSSGPDNSTSGGSADGGNTGGDGIWVCNAQLEAPDNYNGEAVRMVLEQNGTETVLVEGSSISFPYDLYVQGQTGVSTGLIYLYVYNEATGGYDLLVTYENVPFAQAE